MTEVLFSHEIETAAKHLLSGDLVAFPTETVYGLGACAFQEEAIAKIFQVKGRPSDNPLIIHLSNLDQLSLVARDIPEEFYLLYKAFCPGALTLVLPKHPNVPSIACGGQNSVAVRFPSHPIAKALIERAGPLVAPSANISGKPSATALNHVLEDFSHKITAVIDGGATSIGIESTVLSLLDVTKPVLLRPGSINKQDIERVLNREVAIATEHTKIVSPGMKYRHYAPDANVLLFANRGELDGYLLGTSKKQMFLDASSLNRQNLYAMLRLADSQDYEEILVLCEPAMESDVAFMNRLKKAANLSVSISSF